MSSQNQALLAKDRKKKKKKKKKKDKNEPITLRKSSTGTTVGSYKIGSELGKGGFGTVYQGLDTETGHYVAIKQVYIKHVPKDELASIKMEIELLKKLSHENIVRYVDSVEQDGTLNIVLEFVENGSLQGIVSKFGVFKEPLVLKYLVQVLRGLAYLHKQGVIHRDIKGANILTTKDGTVKLADFGVAINFDETASEGECVVGTPYWMAPEIIKMEGVTSKCDIWSVGCVVIELLTEKPPYFELAPMAALFRIVQDVGGPPLPSGISPVLRNFLGACFMGSAESRKSAEELLEHPWCASLLKDRQGKQSPTSKQAPQAPQTLQTLQSPQVVQQTPRTMVPTIPADGDHASPAIHRTVAHHKNVTRTRGSGDFDNDEDEDWGAAFDSAEDDGNGGMLLQQQQQQGSTTTDALRLSLAIPLSISGGNQTVDQEEDPFGEEFDDDSNGPGLTLSIPGLGNGDGNMNDLDGLDDDDDWSEDGEFAEDGATPDQQSAIVQQLKKDAAARQRPSVMKSSSKLSLLNRFREDENDANNDLDVDSFSSPVMHMQSISLHASNEDSKDGSRGLNAVDFGSAGLDLEGFDDNFDDTLGSGSLGDDDDFDFEGVVDLASKLRRVGNGIGADGGDMMGGFDDDDDDDDMAGFGDDDEFESAFGGAAQLDFADAANFESDSKAEVEGIQIAETHRWLVAVQVTETIRERQEAYRALCNLLEAIHACPMTKVPPRRSSQTSMLGGARGSGGRGSIVGGGGVGGGVMTTLRTHHNVRLEQLKVLLGLSKGQDYMLREQLGLVRKMFAFHTQLIAAVCPLLTFRFSSFTRSLFLTF